MTHAPPSESVLVVLVPGLGLDARAWAEVSPGLLDQGLVVLLPSLGQPAGRGTDLTVGHQAGRLLRAVPDRRRLILVGHSASCPVVIEAARRSERVVGLVLVGPVTDPRAQSWPRMLSQWIRTAAHEHLWEAPLLLPQYRKTGVMTMLRGMNAVRRYRSDLGLAQIPLPVVVLRGALDRIAVQDWCQRLAERRRGGHDGGRSSAHGAADPSRLHRQCCANHPGSCSTARVCGTSYRGPWPLKMQARCGWLDSRNASGVDKQQSLPL